MEATTCLQKLQYVGVLAFATVDAHGNPQIHNISAIHYEPDAMYFFTAKGKDFCMEPLANGTGTDTRLHEVQRDDPPFLPELFRP